jgi:hypothetical protein
VPVPEIGVGDFSIEPFAIQDHARLSAVASFGHGHGHVYVYVYVYGRRGGRLNSGTPSRLDLFHRAVLVVLDERATALTGARLGVDVR